MKKKILILISLLALVSAIPACSVKSNTDEFDKIKKQMDEDNKKTNEQLNNVLNSPIFTDGGQPGKINVSGVMVTGDEKNPVLDSRISIKQIPGNNVATNKSPAVEKGNLPILTSIVPSEARAKLKTLRNYVNLNCKDIDEKIIDGLKEDEAKPTAQGYLSIEANTVVICKNMKFLTIGNNIIADHIVLIDLNVLQLGETNGFIGLSTNRLTLIGDNKIVMKSPDSSGIILQPPGVEVSVVEALLGDGHLEIASLGGNRIKTAEKK